VSWHLSLSCDPTSHFSEEEKFSTTFYYPEQFPRMGNSSQFFLFFQILLQFFTDKIEENSIPKP
jgi:hypothetical protein